MVVDEFGGTAGLLTLRDLTTEIIGEVHQANGATEGVVEKLDEISYRIKAQADLYVVNELLGLELPYSDDYQTLGGFLIDRMQRIPQKGDVYVDGDRRWVVLSTDGPKLEDILMTKLNN
jgi:CBS domain containing-hemolysin-like protein